MKTKLIIIIILLSVTIAAAFGFPKPKYKSPDILGILNIPTRMSKWRSIDYSDKLVQKDDDRYNFINDIFARLYRNQFGEQLLFLVLDAGNFHHPKVCFSSSGFEIEEIDGKVITLPDRKVKVKMMYTKKKDENFLLVYWITINGKQVDWTEQKFKQLWYSLFNKKKVGLMVRLDIPMREGRVEQSIMLAQEFFNDIYKELSDEERDYIFGREL